jgi:alpha-tubulin suppressor-like RCC1 family protein
MINPLLFEEIKEYLRSYRPIIPQDPRAAYDLIWRYLIGHPDYPIPSVYIDDLVTAYHQQEKNLEKYLVSLILLSSERKLFSMAQSLGLPEVDKIQIIRILDHLQLLDHDVSLFDLLPKEVLIIIGSQLDCDSLGSFGLISRRFHQLFNLTGELTEMLRIKVQNLTRLDLSHYTKRQLKITYQAENRNDNLSSNGYYSLIFNSQGQIFSFGANDAGQLGLGHHDNELMSVCLSLKDQFIGDITAISAGMSHSLILNTRGQVFSFGTNEYEQLGAGAIEHQNLPTLIETSELGKIITISAGSYHSLLLNSEGQVFSFGANDCGQLGLGENEDENLPMLIKETQSRKIVAISASGSHSLFLDDQGQVFSCGNNEFGQLGLGDCEDRLDLTLIEIPAINIIAISAGGHHSLILDCDGQVYSFGSGLLGRLGHRKSKYRLVPTLIEAPWIGDIIGISAGGEHSLILNSNGQVFSFGGNMCGHLGLGDEKNRNQPTIIKNIGIGRIAAISAGVCHSLIANSEGQVFSFGSNLSGQLGLGDNKNRSIPTLIERFSI